MKRKNKHAILRGSQRMKQQGYKPVQLWLSPRELDAIGWAASEARQPLATWIRLAAYDKASFEEHKGMRE